MRRNDETPKIIKELAGPAYQQIVESYEAAIHFLFAPNRNFQIASLLACLRFWPRKLDDRFTEVCRDIALVEGDDTLRAIAIDALGTVYCNRCHAATSRELADLALDDSAPIPVRRSAYFALRKVQNGFTVTDFKNRLRFLEIAMIKGPADNPGLDEEVRVPSYIGETLEFDMDFVRKFASH